MQIGTTGFTTVTRKGQITVPIQIRNRLGLKQGDRVFFVTKGDEVKIKKTGSVVEQTAGVFRGAGSYLTAKQLRRAAEQAIAEDVLERMGDK